MASAGDEGVGLGWTTATRNILAVFIAAVASFLIVFVCVVVRITNEIIIARRCIMWHRLALLGNVVCLAIMLNLEMQSPQRIILPHLGVVRPVVGIILMFLAFFVSSHQVFRWLVRCCYWYRDC